ncbi:MAG: filamentous hemagglutinin N-terminal domain-containing protein, partial [Verrucomicrobiales bacterium]
MNPLIRSLRRSSRFQAIVVALLLPGLGAVSLPVRANPSGGVVTHGGVHIGEALNGHLMINQLSDKAIINWEDFSIGAGEITQFLQPGAGSAVLNRVVSGNPSAIHGALRANGKVMVINPNGILVGASGSIDVGGLVLSTLDLSDADFLGGGDLVFKGNTNAGVVNYGRINAVGGDVFLMGRSVTNSGTIAASGGTVGLAAGQEVLISASPNAEGERVFVRTTSGTTGGAGVTNSGTIEGAVVELKAHGNMFALAINNSGTVRATGSVSQGGKVFLRAPGGRIENSGSIAATLPGGNGGRILLEASQIDAGGTISADGGEKGGEVTLLGEDISISAGARISANGKQGGNINIGKATAVGATGPTKRVAIGEGAEISAIGSHGFGGSIVISGDLGSVISIAAAALRATGKTSGGGISVGGGEVSISPGAILDSNGSIGGNLSIAGQSVNAADGSLLSANGDSRGGTVRLSAVEAAAIDGRISAIGGIGQGGAIVLNGARSLNVGDGAVVDASGGSNGGSVQAVSNSAGVVQVDGTLRTSGANGKGGLLVVKGGTATTIGGSGRLEDNHATHGGNVIVESVNGTTTVAGEIDAIGSGSVAGRDALVKVLGREVVLTSTADIDASGQSGGGNVLIGGGFQGKMLGVRNASTTSVADGATIAADALESGSGGAVVVWADGTTSYRGNISAHGIGSGGFVEVSGKTNLNFAGTADVTADSGPSGTLLLDPTNVTIGTGVDSATNINNLTLSDLLDKGNNVIIATNWTGTQRGDITVSAGKNTGTTPGGNFGGVEWYQQDNNTVGGTLTLLAAGNILFANDVRSAGAGGINIVAGWNGSTGIVSPFA